MEAGHNALAVEELKHLSIVVCVSPLSALILDQAKVANSTCGTQSKVKADIEKGNFQLVLANPE